MNNAAIQQRPPADADPSSPDDQVVVDYARVLGHDLRAPIAAMGAIANALLEDAVPRLTADDRVYLELIVKQSDRAAAMISALLALSSATQAELHAETFDASVEIDSIVHGELAAVVAESGARVSLHSLPFVHYDKAMFRIALLNLVSNAIKFVPEGRTPRIEIVGHGTTHHQVTIAVKDNGIGIERPSQRRIFDTGVRLNAVRDYEGSGLGLATVRRIVARCGGALQVDSAPGVGSEFRMIVPGGQRVA